MQKLTGAVELIALAVMLGGCGHEPKPAVGTGVEAARPLVVIYMENKERSSIVGNPSAPYMNQLLSQGKDFIHYYGVTHPSLPNYLAIANGSTDGKEGTDTISAGELQPTPTLWNQLADAGISFNVYEESMPSTCFDGTSSGQYQLKHNPAIPFAAVFDDAAVCAHVKPYAEGAALAQVNFITPNMCNDTHDCSITTGDDWLKANLPDMLAQDAKVLITYDEGTTSTNGGGNLYCVEVDKEITHSTNTATFNHYSLLAAIEKQYGLAYLGAAANATPLPLG